MTQYRLVLNTKWFVEDVDNIRAALRKRRPLTMICADLNRDRPTMDYNIGELIAFCERNGIVVPR